MVVCKTLVHIFGSFGALTTGLFCSRSLRPSVL